MRFQLRAELLEDRANPSPLGIPDDNAPAEVPVEPDFPSPPAEESPTDPWNFPEGEIPPLDPELPFNSPTGETEDPFEPYFPPPPPPVEEPIDPWDFPEGEIPPFDPELPFEPPTGENPVGPDGPPSEEPVDPSVPPAPPVEIPTSSPNEMPTEEFVPHGFFYP